MYSLDNIQEFDNFQINQILEHFGTSPSDDLTQNRLWAILSVNQNNLLDQDQKYVSSPYFINLYPMTDQELSSAEQQYGLSTNELSKLNRIRQILDFIFENLQTRIVCVKVKDIRPRYNNLKEWMEDPQNVYIGRRGIVFVNIIDQNGQKKVRWPPQNSIWANPFKVGDDRGSAISKYREYIVRKLDSGEISRSELENLRGKSLGCWCHPEPCHGDVLLELLKTY